MDTAHFFVAVFLLVASALLLSISFGEGVAQMLKGRPIVATRLFLGACVCLAAGVTIIREFAT